MAARVLIADDVSELRSIFRTLLTLDGRFEVVGEAVDGIEAVEQAERLRPDIVILDMAMPRLDGLQAIPKIHAAAPGVRIVVLSGFQSRGLAARAIESCATAFLEKGTAFERIAALVHEVASAPPKAVCATA